MKAWIACGVFSVVSWMWTGCLPGGTEAEGDREIEGITVQVVDSAGAAFGADTVYWSYVADLDISMLPKRAHGSDTTTKAALRLNASGTRWLVTYAGLHGAVYIRARYNRPDSINPAFCSVSAYTHLATNADTLPRTVTLTLNKRRICL